MNIDSIKKIIQNFFQEKTVSIVGSGLSLAEGIPGMHDLANELNNKIPSMIDINSIDYTTWYKISQDLSLGNSLEQALHNTPPTAALEEKIRIITSLFIGKAENNVLTEIIKDNKQLRFSKYLNHFNIRNNGLVVITTNYDRLIEYACEINGICVDNLFVGKFFAQFEPDLSKYMFCKKFTKRNNKCVAEFAPKVTILKPHGCLSWHMVDGRPYSVTYPHLEDSLIITPGGNKYKEGYNMPFDIHRSKANTEIDNALRYIIIGYGFNDDHLETHLIRQLENGKHALILSHSISEKVLNLILKCKNITAICCKNNTDTQVITQTQNITFQNLNLWDLNEMLREVF